MARRLVQLDAAKLLRVKLQSHAGEPPMKHSVTRAYLQTASKRSRHRSHAHADHGATQPANDDALELET